MSPSSKFTLTKIFSNSLYRACVDIKNLGVTLDSALKPHCKRSAEHNGLQYFMWCFELHGNHPLHGIPLSQPGVSLLWSDFFSCPKIPSLCGKQEVKYVFYSKSRNHSEKAHGKSEHHPKTAESST